MRIAAGSIERFTAAERDISSVTVAVSDETVRVMQEKLQRFRRELLELAELDRQPQRVMQLNLQFFPLSKTFSAGGTDA